MMFPDKKIKSILLLCFFSVIIIHTNDIHAEELISSQCVPLVENTSVIEEVEHAKGILWKLTKEGEQTSYIFGTIHLSDKEVTTLPEVVDKALQESKQFVMEVLPDTEQMMLFSKTMFFTDGQLLSAFIDAPIYERTKKILASYHLGADAVSVLKPWAAFLIMNYPPDQGEVLDFLLLSLAQQNGATVAGLETLEEQVDIFSQLAMEEQVKLLTDTVCHYELVAEDLAVMKSLYLERDLAGLHKYVLRFSLSEESVYKKLMKKLIDDRNHLMVKRMQKILTEGNAFIAIGAMHLAGKEGVLTLLEKQGYAVTAVY